MKTKCGLILAGLSVALASVTVRGSGIVPDSISNFTHKAKDYLVDSGLNMLNFGDRVVIEAELPGFSADEIKIWVKDNAITIIADRQIRMTRSHRNYLVHGMRDRIAYEGKTIPVDVNVRNSKAVYLNGILSVEFIKGKLDEKSPYVISVINEQEHIVPVTTISDAELTAEMDQEQLMETVSR